MKSCNVYEILGTFDIHMSDIHISLADVMLSGSRCSGTLADLRSPECFTPVSNTDKLVHATGHVRK